MRIGIVGAGMIGSTVAKLWVDAGHEVRFRRAIRRIFSRW
jgi:predicted dinucleotide-binding enzyme